MPNVVLASALSTPALIGIIAGGVALIAIVFGVFYFVRRRNRNK